MIRFVMLGAVLLVIMLFGMQSGPASADPPDGIVPNLIGSWTTVLSDDLPEDGFACLALDLTEQNNRSFFGGLAVAFAPVDPCIPTDPCRLVISRAGRLTLESHMPGQMLNGHGQYFVTDSGDAMMVMKFQVQYQDGTKKLGSVLMERTAD